MYIIIFVIVQHATVSNASLTLSNLVYYSMCPYVLFYVSICIILCVHMYYFMCPYVLFNMSICIILCVHMYYSMCPYVLFCVSICIILCVHMHMVNQSCPLPCLNKFKSSNSNL